MNCLYNYRCNLVKHNWEVHKPAAILTVSMKIEISFKCIKVPITKFRQSIPDLTILNFQHCTIRSYLHSNDFHLNFVQT